MTRSQTCEQNANHFQHDPVWTRHCQRMAAYRAAQLEVVGAAADAAGKLDGFEKIGRAA